MQPKQTVDLRQSQSLSMSPQLQQAIKLLQMTNFELGAFIESQFMNNPLLDISLPEGEFTKEDIQRIKDQVGFQDQNSEANNHDQSNANKTSQEDESYKNDLESSHLSDYKSLSGSNEELENAHYNFSQELDLRQFLSQQLYASNVPQDIMMIASYLIGSLSDTGYLHESISEISALIMESEEKVEAALRLCQQFEPAGVFARSLSECLKLQLVDKGLYNEKYAILVDNLSDVAGNRQATLLEKLDISKAELSKMVAQIQRLYPKPGLQYSNDPIIPIIPDVFITETANGDWQISLNQATMPKVIINQTYTSYLAKENKDVEKDTKRYLKESYNQATWLIKSLEQRSETILRVATEILRQQDGFFAYGFEHLRPMNLKVVADELDLHESTVSRVTAGKYLRCPRGTFEMKFFFMSGITGSDGEASIASERVRFEIKKMIDSEDPKNVLSDGDIVDRLLEKGIIIARRTVAKYRESIGIQSSTKRRSKNNNKFRYKK